MPKDEEYKDDEEEFEDEYDDDVYGEEDEETPGDCKICVYDEEGFCEKCGKWEEEDDFTGSTPGDR